MIAYVTMGTNDLARAATDSMRATFGIWTVTSYRSSSKRTVRNDACGSISACPSPNKNLLSTRIPGIAISTHVRLSAK
jgi:hypothetical protein